MERSVKIQFILNYYERHNQKTSPREDLVLMHPRSLVRVTQHISYCENKHFPCTQVNQKVFRIQWYRDNCSAVETRGAEVRGVDSALPVKQTRTCW
jgi:hypothetical protein